MLCMSYFICHCNITLFFRQGNVNAKWVSPGLNVKQFVHQTAMVKPVRMHATVYQGLFATLEMENA